MKIKVSKRFLLLIIVSAIIRIYFISETPVYWNGEMSGLQAFNDEPAHINYVKYIMRFDKLPVQTQSVKDEDAFQTFTYEYYQPPLTYHIVAYIAKIFHFDPFGVGLIYFSRSIALLFGLITIYLFYIFTHRLLDNNTALFLSWLYALAPVHIRHTSTFSNDVLLWVFLLLLFISITSNRGESKYYGIIDGFILGAAILTKSSALVLFGLFAILSIADRKNYQRWLITIFIAFLCSLPYFLRNHSLYGEFIGIGISHGEASESLSKLDPFVWFKFFRSLIISSAFPYDTIPIPFFVKLPSYLTWIGIIFGSLIMAVIAVIKNYLNLKAYVPHIVWLLSFFAMLAYNWSVLMVEFRVIFFAFPMLLLIFDKSIMSNIKLSAAVFFFAVVYPLILVFIYG